ncbi:MAG: hypothetical protein PHU77_10310 [Simplicispira sp.]|nr:hypothetical protein [Simplicispira sp.]
MNLRPLSNLSTLIRRLKADCLDDRWRSCPLLKGAAVFLFSIALAGAKFAAGRRSTPNHAIGAGAGKH